MKVRYGRLLIMIVGSLFFFGCNKTPRGLINAEGSTIESSGGLVVFRTIEEWTAARGAQWFCDDGALLMSLRVAEPFTPVESFDFTELLRLSDSELQRIKEISINGTRIANTHSIDFTRFTSLEQLNVAYTNLDSLKGLDNTPIKGLGLNNIPLQDISVIENLIGLKSIGLGQMRVTELKIDLSRLRNLHSVNLIEPGLESIESIRTIPNPFMLSVVGAYNKLPISIEAFRAVIGSKAEGVYMHYETREMYGEPLQEVIEEARKYNPGFFISGFGE